MKKSTPIMARRKVSEAERRYFMDYSRSALEAARGWRESASYARKIGDRSGAAAFSRAAREAARAARAYAADARGQKLFPKTRRSR